MLNINNMRYKTDLICPITGSPLWNLGSDSSTMDSDTWYSPESDASIIFAKNPRQQNLYRLVECQSNMERASRYFRLNDDKSWTEMKRVPNGDELFTLDDFGDEWNKACEDGAKRLEEQKIQNKYWDEHPSEDPRIHAKTVGIEEVSICPMGPPSGVIFYLDLKTD